jgi:hypothetical protein
MVTGVLAIPVEGYDVAQSMGVAKKSAELTRCALRNFDFIMSVEPYIRMKRCGNPGGA